MKPHYSSWYREQYAAQAAFNRLHTARLRRYLAKQRVATYFAQLNREAQPMIFNWWRLVNLATIAACAVGLFYVHLWSLVVRPLVAAIYIVCIGIHVITLWNERKNPWWARR